MEHWIVGRMLKEGLDVYLPLVDDDAIDAVIRRPDGTFHAHSSFRFIRTVHSPMIKELFSMTLKWGISWQITPRALTDAMAAGGKTAQRAFAAMMEMDKIDIAKIQSAIRG